MEEFIDVMKQWKRMCASMRGKECSECPMHVQKYACDSIHINAGPIDYHSVQGIVMKWAKQNPEPVFPTWAEWLKSMGVLLENDIPLSNGAKALCSTGKMDEQVPIELAQILRLKPKEEKV